MEQCAHPACSCLVAAKGEFGKYCSEHCQEARGMTELVLGTDLTEEQHSYLEIVKSSADSLLGLINDILDFSKIEAGKLELHHIEFNLREIVDEMLQLFAERAHARLRRICRRRR